MDLGVRVYRMKNMTPDLKEMWSGVSTVAQWVKLLPARLVSHA